MTSLILIGGISLAVVFSKIGDIVEKKDDDFPPKNEHKVELFNVNSKVEAKSKTDYARDSANEGEGLVEKQEMGNEKKIDATAHLEVISIERIWGKDHHDAFTSLVENDGVLYCAFRHAADHNSRDGKIQVIKSRDGGNSWEEDGFFALEGKDLRDPKLTVNSNGEVVLIGLTRSSTKENNRHFTYTWKLVNNQWTSSNLAPNSEDTWKWGVGRVGNQIYSIAYSGKDKFGTLYNSKDGQQWNKVADRIFPDVKDFPNETAFVELDDNSMLCLLRKNKGNKNAKLGLSRPPYTSWEWKDLDKQIGGPSLIKLPNGDIYACVRLYGPVRTSICKVDVENGQLEEIIKLPSGYDTSYAGMILYDDNLYVSYYSNHETGKGKSAVYLAKIKI